MNISEESRIWRDALDHDTFHVGDVTESGHHCQWFSLPVTGIGVVFGHNAQGRAERLEPGKPVPLADVLDAPDTETGKD